VPRAVAAVHEEALLVIISRGAVVGTTRVAVRETLTVDEQLRAIEASCGERIQRRDGVMTFRTATGAPRGCSAARRDISVVVCTRDRDDVLHECLASLTRLRTPPCEIIVVDSAPSSDATRDVCRAFPVRYLRENRPGLSRARNRGVLGAVGDVIAFTDDDVSVDVAWLDDLESSLADSLVMAVTGFVAPLELATSAQYAFEAHGGFGRGFEPTIFNGAFGSPYRQASASGVGANLIIRRRAFSEVGMFDEGLGAGTPVRSAEDTDMLYRILGHGFRVSYEPQRIVWHRHRRDHQALRHVLFGYGAGVSGHAMLSLIRHRDLGAARMLAWWCRYLARDMASLIGSNNSRRLPARAVAAEIAGTAMGPLLAVASRRRASHPPSAALDEPESAALDTPHPVVRELPRISVVIPSHQRCAVLSRVLRALHRQSWPADRFEVIVALDGSTDGSAEMVRAVSATLPLTLITLPQGGAAKARNAGAEAASSPVVVFLDDDVIPGPDFVLGHAQAHAHENGHKTVALGYCSTPVRQSGVWALALRSWWEDRFRRMAEPGHPWTYGDFQSLNVSVSRTLLSQLGGFDDRFGTARREDWELGLRLLQHGASFTYAPNASARHELDASFATSLRHRRLEAIGDLVFLEAHPTLLTRLPLAGMLRDLSPTLRSRLLSRTPPKRRRDRVQLAALPVLEATGLRGRWLGVAFQLLHAAYLDGIREVMPDPDDRAALLRRTERAQVAPVVWLDRPQTGLLVPPEGLGQISVGRRGAVIGTLQAMEPSGQWDWREVAERVGWAIDWAAAQRHEPSATGPSTLGALALEGTPDAGR
jgi:GT2 family glycosyltransferase